MKEKLLKISFIIGIEGIYIMGVGASHDWSIIILLSLCIISSLLVAIPFNILSNK